MALMPSEEKVLCGLWGAVVGDALGVPVEFQSRQERQLSPVTGMREYGTYHQPPGTWSDDSSLMMCTVESLVEGFDLTRLGRLFVRWLYEAYWTPWGEVFDVGITTNDAVQNLARGTQPELAGLGDVDSNGNGSLMRILPIALYHAQLSTDALLDLAHRTSSLTHRHVRSQMACGFYGVVAAALHYVSSTQDAYHIAIQRARILYQRSPFVEELPHFNRLFAGELASLPESAVRSSGYVIHTLEASLWCLLTSDSFPEAVLKAVNLGDDTDTTATVTGGLAGIHHGRQAIPAEWVSAIARREDLNQLFQNFVSKLAV